LPDFTQDPNCKGAWCFEEGAGVIVADSSGNSYQGNFAAAGHPAWDLNPIPFGISGAAPYSAHFTPTSDYITTASSAEMLESFSTVALIVPHAEATDPIILGRQAGVGIPLWAHNYYLLLTAGKLKFGFKGVTIWEEITQAAKTMAEGTAYYVAGVHDNDAHTVTIYINAVQVGKKTGTSAVTISPNLFFAIGRHAYNATNYWDGLIAEAAVFNRVLTVPELAEISNYGLKGITHKHYPISMMKKNLVSGFHVFINQYIRAQILGYNPCKLPDGTVF